MNPVDGIKHSCIITIKMLSDLNNRPGSRLFDCVEHFFERKAEVAEIVSVWLLN